MNPVRAPGATGSVLRNYAECRGYQIKKWAEGLGAGKPFRVIRPDGTTADFATSRAAIDFCETDSRKQSLGDLRPENQTQENDDAPTHSPGPEPPLVDR